MKNQTSPVVRPVTFENAGGIRAAGADAGSQGRRRAYRAFGRIPVPVVQLCRRLHVRREPRAAGHDRMGVFNTRDGGFRLVRNHEDRNAPGAGSTALAPGKSYDMNGGAGTNDARGQPVHPGAPARFREQQRNDRQLPETSPRGTGGDRLGALRGSWMHPSWLRGPSAVNIARDGTTDHEDAKATKARREKLGSM